MSQLVIIDGVPTWVVLRKNANFTDNVICIYWKSNKCKYKPKGKYWADCAKGTGHKSEVVGTCKYRQFDQADGRY
jgi:ribosomal protein L39E